MKTAEEIKKSEQALKVLTQTAIKYPYGLFKADSTELDLNVIVEAMEEYAQQFKSTSMNYPEFKKFSLHGESEPTTTSDNTSPEKPDNSEHQSPPDKPDFHEMAVVCIAGINFYTSDEMHETILQIETRLERIWTDYVIPLQEENKKLKDSFHTSERFRAQDAASAILEENELRAKIAELEIRIETRDKLKEL